MTDPWPEVVVGQSYEVKGEVGVCVQAKASGFGHRWGLIRFADGREQWVRTKLLTAKA